jgi:hypothetical protein
MTELNKTGFSKEIIQLPLHSIQHFQINVLQSKHCAESIVSAHSSHVDAVRGPIVSIFITVIDSDEAVGLIEDSQHAWLCFLNSCNLKSLHFT